MITAERTQHLRETVLFAMLAAVMFCSKILLEFLPNIHLLGVLTMVYTIVFRYKALYPIYLYVIIQGLWLGFSVWWVPYLYVWTVLWGSPCCCRVGCRNGSPARSTPSPAHCTDLYSAHSMHLCTPCFFR